MFKFTQKFGGWEITEKGQVLFSEIKTPNEAIAIAKANRAVLTEFKDLNKKVA